METLSTYIIYEPKQVKGVKSHAFIFASDNPDDYVKIEFRRVDNGDNCAAKYLVDAGCGDESVTYMQDIAWNETGSKVSITTAHYKRISDIIEYQDAVKLGGPSKLRDGITKWVATHLPSVSVKTKSSTTVYPDNSRVFTCEVYYIVFSEEKEKDRFMQRWKRQVF
jgi:hypothetical protein